MRLDLDRTPPGGSTLLVAEDLALLEGSLPAAVRLEGELAVDNLGKRFLVRGDLVARGRGECGRCLAEFELTYPVPVEIMILRGGEQEGEDEGEHLVIHQRTGEVDLDDALRESAILAVPLVTVCDQDCRGLCIQCGADLNRGPCTCDPESPDPRWEGLPDA
ncbi:MAG: DUF177 domain-containing protein [Candidatus Krumholzibacteriia bacterium]